MSGNDGRQGDDMNPVRAVFFDAVGTIIHPEPPAADVYLAIGRRHGTGHSLEEIRTRFQQALQIQDNADRERAWRTSEDRERLRWRDVVAFVLDDVGDMETCFAELYAHFGRPEVWRLDNSVAPLLQLLLGRCVVGLASNYDRRLHSVLAGFAALRPMDHVVISSEVGYRKPSKVFFRHLVQTTELPASEVLYLGDDQVNDVNAARSAGLQAMLVESPRGLEAIAGDVLELVSVG